MSKEEVSQGAQNIVKVDRTNRQIVVNKPNSSAGEPPKVYLFDNVFDDHSTQVSNILFSSSPFKYTLLQ